MSSAVWKFQFDGLSPSLRVLAPDLRGHGLSRGVSGDLNFNAFADDLIDLFDRLNLSNAILVGWSMGAQIALQSCAELSGRLAGMVLVSGTPCFSARDGFPHGAAESEVRGMRLKVQRNLQRALNGFYSRLFAEGELENNAAAPEIKLLLQAIESPDTAAVLDALEALAGADMRYLLANISVPTLILNGASDQICLPQASNYLKEHIPGAEQTVFHCCGHAPFLTYSTKFNAEINRFTGSMSGENA
jgi:pimeloyl-[acyl-carrier protein] methyl ester esterase